MTGSGRRRHRSLGELDLNLLVALDALLRERNVTRAGQRVGMSQPTMSTALGKLRRFFDDDLLERTGREFRLTPVANELAEPIQEILLLLQRAIDGPTHFDPGEGERTFRILASDYNQLMLHAVVRRVAEEAPGFRLRFETPDEQSVQRMRTRQCDLVVLSRMARGLSSRRLFEDRWVCAMDADHPDIDEELTREQFIASPHVAFGMGVAGRSGAEVQLAAAGVERDIRFTTESFTSSLFLLRGTRLIAIVQERLANLLADTAAIKVRPLPVPLPAHVSRLWWNPADTEDHAHTWLRSVFFEVADDL